MSTRSYLSGALKRKKKQRAEEELSKLTKLDSFLTKIDKGPDEPKATVSQSRDIHPIPDTEPGTSSCIESTSTIEATNIQIYKPGSSTSTAESASKNKQNDVGVWGDLSKDEILYWVEKGPSECQHSNGSFEKSKKLFANQDRYCSKSLFYPKRANGEKYCREWLVYSPATGRVYCFVCKLFANSSTSLSCDGFCDWRNTYLVQRHENSVDHRTASVTYLTRKRGSTIDCQLAEEINNKRQYWKNVLERVVAVIITMAERGLPFRGDKETFGSPQKKLPDVDYKKRRYRRRHINDDEGDALENLESRDKFRIKTFIPVMDALESSLAQRASVYNDAAKKFSFLTKLEASEEEIYEGVSALYQTYPEDVDMNLVGEVKHFHQYVRHSPAHGSAEQDSLTHQDLYRVIFNDRVQSTFPNVEATLRLFLSMMVTNCSGERSFSQLKRIKNDFRTTITQDKLCSFSLMCIESDKLRSLSFDDVISDFALAKVSVNHICH